LHDDHRITAAGRAERRRGDAPPGPHAAGPGISTPAGRIVALDSLRGLAAFAVVIYHCLMVFPGPAVTLAGNGTPFHAPDGGGLRVLLLTASPPSLFWSGREAVLLFFVLSGFVLTLPFLSGRRPSYLPFAAKRFCRLVLPSAAVVLPVAALVPMLAPSERPELSHWFNASWREEVTPALVLRHALLLDRDYALNSAMWTLHQEWRVSLLFPLLMLLAACGARVLLAVAFVALVLAWLERKVAGHGGLLETFFYLPHFVFGVLVARNREQIVHFLGTLDRRARIGLWILCYVLLDFRWLVPAPPLVWDMANGAGAALLIALVIGSARAQAALCWRPLVALGTMSYSLYLVHLPVILATVHLAPAWVPPALPLVAAPLVSIALALALFHTVERPAMRLGRSLARTLEHRRPAMQRGGLR
jgi:peptidoglycan/LPS O-acetylase OafA/YrhL